VGSLVFGALTKTEAYGIVCLTGVSSGGHRLDVDAGLVNRDIVLENEVVVGSVNANLRHYQQGADVLARADNEWLEGLVTRRVPLENAAEAFQPADGDVKVIIELDGGN
jgi:threonine dehydrogenase-like Zn-dependent dehydrogenase